MKSVKYVKHRRSKYKFRTKIDKGTKNNGRVVKQGSNKPGSVAARADIERKLNRTLKLHKTAHTVGEWVFIELAE
jgi:hypothetical protein